MTEMANSIAQRKQLPTRNAHNHSYLSITHRTQMRCSYSDEVHSLEATYGAFTSVPQRVFLISMISWLVQFPNCISCCKSSQRMCNKGDFPDIWIRLNNLKHLNTIQELSLSFQNFSMSMKEESM